MVSRTFRSQQIDEIVFITLQIIDGATLFSKEEVLKEYEVNKDVENIEELLYEKAIYPDGEQLGFYNTSKYSLKDFYESNLSKAVWKEYFDGFSSEIKELFNIVFKNHSVSWKHFKPYDGELPEKREDINYFYLNSIDNLLNYDMYYINYHDLCDNLIKILFEGFEFKDNVSVLHIGAESTFLFSCLNYIKNINPDCDVELYMLTTNWGLALALNFFAMINKTKFVHSTVRCVERYGIAGSDYNQFFECHKNFDFVIKSDPSKRPIPEKEQFDGFGHKYIQEYGVTVSSRSIYVIDYKPIKFYEEWLEDDVLESLISIPYRNKYGFAKFYKNSLLLVFNYNKVEEKKNKFLVIDNNENKVITSKEYNLEDYRDLIDNKNIYENSYNLFSNFSNSKYSKLFDVKNLLNKEYFYFNDEMYDVKMITQKKYYKIEHFKGNERIIKPLNYKTEKLGKLINITPEDIKPNKTLFLLREGERLVDEQWVYFNHEIVNLDQFLSLELISDKVTLEYLYYYLNSQVGINEYNYFAREIVSLIEVINQITVAIPPKNIQDKIVEAMTERDDFLNDVKLLKSRTDDNFFDYKQNKSVVDEFYGKRNYSIETQELSMPDNWIYTYGGLVWPLAITYLIATSGGFEKVEKANNLLKLFEFTTAFNAIVLISGVPEEIYEKHKHKIWKKAYDDKNNDGFVNFYKLTFGSWVTFHYKLKKIYKKRFDTKINKEFFINLLDNNIIEYYNNLKEHRNKEFHEGITNSYEAETLIKELNIPKTKVFNYLNECYKNFRLYYVTGGKTPTNEHNVIFLNGPYSMPIYSTIPYNGDLESDELYLYDIGEDKFCKLNSKLIKFMALDDEKHDWRLYIFIGFEIDDEGNKKAMYKCYQRKEEELEVYFDLNELM